MLSVLHPFKPEFKQGSYLCLELSAIALCFGSDAVVGFVPNADMYVVMGHSMDNATEQGIKQIKQIIASGRPVVWFATDPDYTLIPLELWPNLYDKLRVHTAFSDWKGMRKALLAGTDKQKYWLPPTASYHNVWYSMNKNRYMPPRYNALPGLTYIGYNRSAYRAGRLAEFKPILLNGHSASDAVPILNSYFATLVVGDPLYKHMPLGCARLLQGWAASTLTIVDKTLFGECPYEGLEPLWVASRDEAEELLCMSPDERLGFLALQQKYLSSTYPTPSSVLS